MKTNDTSTPTWVQPVDGATCAAISRELWGMLSNANVYVSVGEFADYVTSCTRAFQRVYADAEWGVTHDWAEETETFLLRYLREFPVAELSEASEDDDCAGGFIYLMEPTATQVIDHDNKVDAAGATLALSLDAANIRCRHYGDGVIEVEWDRGDADLRVVVGDLGEGLVIDVLAQSYDDDGEMGPPVLYDEDIPWSDLARVVDAITKAKAPF